MVNARWLIVLGSLALQGCVSHLSKVDGEGQPLIQTVRGVGYTLRLPRV